MNQRGRNVKHYVTLGLCFLVAICASAVGEEPLPANTGDSFGPWKFVSIPDFLNNDVDYPEPKWDDALDYVLQSIKAEEPDFLLVAGDLVMGRWSQGQKHLETMAAKYYSAWVERMRAHGLKYYVALGDHEIGDDPWRGEKRKLVPHYKAAFRKYLQMPTGGPDGFERTAFAVRHKNLLLVTVDQFDQDNVGNVHVRVGEGQLNWIRDSFAQNHDAAHRVVMGHVPVLSGWRWRSSSRFSMPGADKSPLWRLMAELHTDLYLCGEVHDISIQQQDDVLQVVHGSQASNVNEFNYLVVTVHSDRLELELKSIETELIGPHDFALDPFGVDPYRQRGVRITKSKKQEGFSTVGTMRIDKKGKDKSFSERRGFFESRYNENN